jgi:virginiamycin B lyase
MKVLRVASFVLLGAVPATAQDASLEPKEWTVPWERTRPRDPVMDQSGRVWFVGQVGNYIAYLDPKSGEFKRYQIADGTNPHNIVVDERGGVWYTGNRNGRIVQLDPKTGELKNFMMPDSTLRDPHTMIWDRNGVAWFTAQRSNKVGRLDRATGEIRVWTPSVRGNPYGVAVNSKGQPWFNLFATNKIATVDPKTMEYKEYALADDRTRARRLALTSDDAIWYGDYRGYLGRLDPKTGAVQEWALPSGPAAQPYAMTSDDKDRVWVVETGVNPNRLVGFDTKSKTWVANIPIPSHGAERNAVRHMTYNRATREIWFGTDVGMIGSVKVPAEIRTLTP